MVDFDKNLLSFMTPEERVEWDRLLDEDGVQRVWRALPGPQLQAELSEADILGYGGSAGGGKSDLLVGLSLTRHLKTAIFRQNGTELVGIIDRFTEVLGSRDGFNGKDKIWTVEGADSVRRQIEFGSFPAPGEEAKYQGRPHDLIGLDEAANMRESAVRFLLGWLRSTVPGQRKRAVLTFNPPTTVEGRWILKFFAPWLDRKHPNPAQPGELRWFATIDGVDVEVPDNRPFVVVGKSERVYDYDPATPPDQVIEPMSRSFIPSRVADNPYLHDTGYMRVLQSMPEPLRSQLLYGDFQAGVSDDPWQVIPTAWVEAAQARWTRPGILPPMDSIGVDVALGGDDKTVIARRHGEWFDEPIVYTGRQCVDGPTIASFILAAKRDGAVTHLDLFGVGAQPYGSLMELQQQVVGVNVGDKAPGVDASGRLRFYNIRSMLWWRMREALDPASNQGIALPPSKELLADLCAPWWTPVGGAIKVAGRQDIVDKIGRSPDYASAYVLALLNTPKRDDVFGSKSRAREHNPYEDF